MSDKTNETAETTAPKSKIPEAVTKLAAKITERLALDEAGNGVVPDTIFSETLPETLTMDTVNEVREHDCHFAAAATQAYGQMAAKHFVGDKVTQTGTAVFPMGSKHNLVEVSYTGRDETRKPGSSTGEMVTRHGITKIIVQTALDPKAKTGAMGAVTREIAAAALEAQGGK